MSVINYDLLVGNTGNQLNEVFLTRTTAAALISVVAA